MVNISLIIFVYLPIADSYILQIQRFEAPMEQLPSTPPIASQTPLNHPSLPLQSLLATKSSQSGTRNLLFIELFDRYFLI